MLCAPQVRIQETQAELPRGSIPRSVEVVLRAEAVETAQAGDHSDFTGTLIVVPDVAALAVAGLYLLPILVNQTSSNLGEWGVYHFFFPSYLFRLIMLLLMFTNQ